MTAKSAFFTNQNHESSDHTSAIIPLFSTEEETNQMFFIGTAFYISGSGILMTARHNLFKDDKVLNNLSVMHLLPENQYLIRPIGRSTHSNEYDIAYLFPHEILHKGTPLASSTLTLTDLTPEISDQLGTYNYSNIKKTGQEFHFIPTFYLGECVEYYERGCGILKNPCFQTNIRINGGASGGPVFDKLGGVFAVCSTGYDVEEGTDDISFVTPILPSFNLLLNDGVNEKTMSDLIQNKVITFEKS